MVLITKQLQLFILVGKKEFLEIRYNSVIHRNQTKMCQVALLHINPKLQLILCTLFPLKLLKGQYNKLTLQLLLENNKAILCMAPVINLLLRNLKLFMTKQ